MGVFVGVLGIWWAFERCGVVLCGGVGVMGR
jgi:hypothetical protein